MTPTRPALVVALVFLALYAPFVTVNGVQTASRPAVDLPSFHYAAVSAFQKGESPYTEQAGRDLERRIGQKVFPYLYPPPSLLLFAPLAAFSYPTAKTLVLVGNHLLVLLFLYLTFFRLVRPSVQGAHVPWIRLVMALYVLVFQPLAVTLDHGQVNLLVAVLLVLYWLARRSERHPALTAAPLAVAILLKTYPAVFLLALLVRRAWRLCAWTAGYLAAACAAALAVLPRQAWSDWWRDVLPTGGFGQVPFGSLPPAMPWNQSINGFAARLFGHPVYAAHPNQFLATAVPWLGAAAVIGVLVWLSLRLDRQRQSPDFDDGIPLVLLSMFLIAPLSWEHHLVLVLPAILFQLHRILVGSVTGGWAVATGLAVLVMAWPLPFLFDIRSTGPLGLLVSLKFFAVVVLWSHFLRRMWTPSSAAKRPPARPLR